ncbi:MAG: 16S rRNA (guanine(527)-N(7))-methyltransferase RsmG [Clostridia bacterium]|nr:16S rRNA (guanine(527)-N(7))-methyltransferase RsmG [Clostridia bacterium]
MNKESLRQSAARCGIGLTDEMLEKFAVYADFLREYNQKVNLTAITDPEEISIKHFEDSLAILKYIAVPQEAAVADVGTGAGFPGVPLLIARGDLRLTLIEATGKKLVFVEQLLRKLDLRAELVHMRGEDAGRDPAYRERFDVVTARAVAELNRLAEYCLPLTRINGVFVAMKAQTAENELANAVSAIRTLGGSGTTVYEYPLSNGDTRTLLSVKKISQTSPQFPRSGALIAKKPL